MVSITAVFRKFDQDQTIALLPGSANMLVLREHLVIPDPLLPAFRDHMQATFEGLGLKPHFVPSLTYHFNDGQLHCGTNVMRHPIRFIDGRSRDSIRRIKVD